MSETYRALTRKYRPRSFDDVVSQEHIINTLRNAIEQNRISHAYLFCGPRGVGKTTMARVVARMINGVGMDVDGEALGRTLDIIEIDAASNSGVEDVRSLRDGVRIPPQTGKYKVYIIDEVHMLSKQAFNALLKTLEEPPEHVKFIFATTEPHKVLATVLSRVQRFDFRRIKVSEMVDRLRFICNEEKIKIDDESLHLIGRKADGALRDALSILDQVIAFCGDDIKYDAVLNALNAISNDKLFEIIECSVSRDASRGMHIVHELLLQGHDIQEFLVSITEHIRNMYFSRFATTEGTLLEVTTEEKKRLLEASKQFTEQDLLRMMHLTSEAQVKIRDSQQPRVLLEITILKLIMMDRAEGLNELLAELRELKKKTSLTGDFANSETTVSKSNSDSSNSNGKGAPAKKNGDAISDIAINPPRKSSAPGTDNFDSKTDTSSQKPVENNHNDTLPSNSSETPNSVIKPEIKDALFGKPAIKKSVIKDDDMAKSINPSVTDKIAESTEDKNHSTGAEKTSSVASQPKIEDRLDKQGVHGQDTITTQNQGTQSHPGKKSESKAPLVSDSDSSVNSKAGAFLGGAAVKASHSGSKVQKNASNNTNGTPGTVSDSGSDFNSRASSNGAISSNLGDNAGGNTVGKNPVNASESTSEVNKNFIPRQLIESRYEQWIAEVRKVCPQFVAISLIKTRLIETGEDFVVIECQDKLVEQLFDEHNENLTACLAKVIERNVSIKTKVIVTQSTSSTNDPFASLKQLQELNPVVKTIVDVLGAELEY